MKTTILLILAAVLAAFAPTSVRAVDDIHVTYEEGRAAFFPLPPFLPDAPSWRQSMHCRGTQLGYFD